MPGPSAPSSVLNIRMTNILMLLRKCCNHPYLLECPLEEGTLLRKVDEDLVNCSGKMLLLDRMLPSLKEGGHKVQYKAIYVSCSCYFLYKTAWLLLLLVNLILCLLLIYRLLMNVIY